MIEYEEKNRVGWEELFSIYLHPHVTEMEEEATEGF